MKYRTCPALAIRKYGLQASYISGSYISLMKMLDTSVQANAAATPTSRSAPETIVNSLRENLPRNLAR